MRYQSAYDLMEANGKTWRENNQAKVHNIPLGTLVEVKYDRWHGDGACSKVHAPLFVVHQGRDCDGTPLYWLAETMEPKPDGYQLPDSVWSSLVGKVGGFTEVALTRVAVTAKLADGYGALSWEPHAEQSNHPVDHHPDLIVRPEDMDFIVAARTRWPAALARIRELEAKCKGLEEERDGLRQTLCKVILSTGVPLEVVCMSIDRDGRYKEITNELQDQFRLGRDVVREAMRELNAEARAAAAAKGEGRP